MSNNLDITIYDFKNICRTCLSREDLKPLYEKGFSSTCLADKLMSCTFVKFTVNDGLPVKICANCILEMDQAISFAKRCETTDTILRQCVKKIETEIANNESQTAESIIKVEEEMKIEIKSEIILPNIQEVLGDYEYLQENFEVKLEEEIVLKNESDETCNYAADEISENQDEMISENPGYNIRTGSSNSNCVRPAKRKDDISKMNYESKKCSEKFPDFKHREEIKHPANALSPCSVCNKMFVNKNMKQHMRTHSGENPYSCKICGVRFNVSNNLSRHIHTQHSQSAKESSDFQWEYIHGEKKFVCSVCKRGFVRENLLKSHSQIHMTVRSHTCDVCGKGLSNLGQLKLHKLIHTGEKPHACSVCSKSFTQLSNLRVHMKQHTGVKPHVCSVCNKAFIILGQLKVHMRIHTGEKPHVCSICSKAFSQFATLGRHMKIHTGEKSNVCSVCSKGFVDPMSLKYHLRQHTGEKPHVCTVCSKAFAQSKSLRLHMRNHSGEKPYGCFICCKTFTTSSTLKDHIRTHTGEKPHVCCVCSKAFIKLSNLKVHLRTHTCNKPVIQSTHPMA